jgi:hypothetical protein
MCEHAANTTSHVAYHYRLLQLRASVGIHPNLWRHDALTSAWFKFRDDLWQV